MNHVIALSGGKDSVALALRLRELNPDVPYQYISTPTGNELPEFFAHFDRLEQLLQAPIVRIAPQMDGIQVVGWREWREGDGLIDLIRRHNMLPNFRARWCTRQLKIEPTLFWLAEHSPAIQYVGLRADEGKRGGIYPMIPSEVNSKSMPNRQLREMVAAGVFEGISQQYPMQQWGWSLDDVWSYLDGRGVSIPERTDCGLCFYQRLLEWKRLHVSNPDAFAAGVAIEQEIGHTFRSNGRDTWPASLADMAAEFDRGRLPQGYEASRQLRLVDCDRDDLCRVCTM